jgi:hypothetical protein
MPRRGGVLIGDPPLGRSVRILPALRRDEAGESMLKGVRHGGLLQDILDAASSLGEGHPNGSTNRE